MKKNIPIFMAGFITCFMLFASATTAFAAANGTTISAMLNGPVLKSYTLVPGETVNIEADITGVSKLYITTEVKTNHDNVNKFIIGEPVFMN